MREYVKGYRAFVSDKWIKLLLYLVYPLCAIGFCRLAVTVSDLYGFLHQALVASIMIFAEYVLDVSTFGNLRTWFAIVVPGLSEAFSQGDGNTGKKSLG